MVVLLQFVSGLVVPAADALTMSSLDARLRLWLIMAVGQIPESA